MSKNTLDTTIRPKEITRCVDTGLNTASFSYSEGIEFAKKNNKEQTTEFSEVRREGKFIVCCGDIMVKVEEEDYSDMIRRDF
tara:strand:- start:544 stop:789 length:246 start_codon:yes stop_codon:yes gene_type:complete